MSSPEGDARVKAATAVLQATRRMDSPVNSIFEEEYRARWEALWALVNELIEPSSPKPPLLVVYSLSARTETFYVDGEAVVVYDQYLGQVLAQLNRHLACDASPEHVDKYLAKLLAQFSLTWGDRQRALRFALLELSFGLGLPGLPLLEEAALMTTLAEVFVLAHEISHIVWGGSDTSPDHPYTDVRGLVLDLVEDSRNGWRDSTQQEELRHAFAAEYVADVDRAWERRHGPTSESDRERADRDELIKQIFEDSESPLTRLDSPGFHEEQFCDLQAFVITRAWCRAMSLELSDGRIFAACLDALHELRVLASLRHTVAAGFTELPLQTDLLEAVYRSSTFRRGVMTFLRVLGHDADTVQSFGEEAIRTNQRFATVLGDQVLFHLDVLIARAEQDGVDSLASEVGHELLLDRIQLPTTALAEAIFEGATPP